MVSISQVAVVVLRLSHARQGSNSGVSRRYIYSVAKDIESPIARAWDVPLHSVTFAFSKCVWHPVLVRISLAAQKSCDCRLGRLDLYNPRAS